MRKVYICAYSRLKYCEQSVYKIIFSQTLVIIITIILVWIEPDWQIVSMSVKKLLPVLLTIQPELIEDRQFALALIQMLLAWSL